MEGEDRRLVMNSERGLEFLFKLQFQLSVILLLFAFRGRKEQVAHGGRVQFVDTPDLQFAAGDEVLCFFHYHPHLFQVVGGDATETA